MKKLNTLCFVSVLTFVLVLSLASIGHSAEAICQSEADCAQQCEDYEQALNENDSIEEIYNCTLTGFTEVVTIEADGTTMGHTEYNCFCTAIGMKDVDGDGGDGGDRKPTPPVILNPLIPDFPGGELPPDNGFAECMSKANQREIEMRQRCGNEILQAMDPEDSVDKKWDTLFKADSFYTCIENAKKIGDEMRLECHRKWSKKSIGQIIQFGQ